MKIRKNLIFILALFALIGIISISAASAFGPTTYSPPITYKPPTTYTPPVTTYKPPTTYTPPVTTYKPPTTYTPYIVNYDNPAPPINFNSPSYAGDYQKYLNAKAIKSYEDYKKLQQQKQTSQANKAYNEYKKIQQELNSIKKSTSSSKADLKITKTTKSGNTHKVYITNFGKKAAGKSYLSVYDGKKLIKKVSVKSIGSGKTIEIKVPINKRYKNKYKNFKADSTNIIKESNEKNNVLKAK